MSKAVLIIGKSGSGKSSSIRNLDPKETFIIKCTNKELPFKGGDNNYKSFAKDSKGGNLLESKDSETIVKCLSYISRDRPEIKNIVIDDKN